MTPNLEDLEQPYLLNPEPGTLHIHDLINEAMDGPYAKDYISDYVLGMILWALYLGIIAERDGAMVFQLPFVHPGFTRRQFRNSYEHYGRAFLGPDGRILTLEGRRLCGDGKSGAQVSNLDAHGVRNHPNYANWLKEHLFAGREPDDLRYVRVYPELNTKQKCDDHVDEEEYYPGPLSVPF